MTSAIESDGEDGEVKFGHFVLNTWGPLLFWIAIIVLETTLGSSVNTGALLQWLMGLFFEGIDSAQFDISHFIIRKGGHFVGYGILGYLWFRTFLRVLNRSTLLTSAALAVACALLIASLDEWHQSFLSDRTGSTHDVALDTLGAIVLISLAMVLVTRSSFHSEPSEKRFAVGGEAVIDLHTTDAFIRKTREQAGIAGCSLNASLQRTLKKQLSENEQKAAPKTLARNDSDDLTIKAFVKALQDHDREERELQKAHFAKRHAQENEDRERLVNCLSNVAQP